MSWIEEKYIQLLSSQLKQYKLISTQPYAARFRCPLCGDSDKNTTKSRGNIYNGDDRKLYYKCFNCGASMHAGSFLKTVDSTLYSEYIFEKFKGGAKKRIPTIPKKLDLSEESMDRSDDRLIDRLLTRLKYLPDTHVAVQYCKRRKISPEKYKHFYYIDNVQKIEQLSEKYRNKIVGIEDRLVIPVYSRQHHLTGIICRALEKHRLKYLNIKIKEGTDFIYNYDQVNLTQTVRCVEGAVDSTFIDNCIAVSTSSLHQATRYVPKEQLLLIYDNQPRNKEIVKLMGKGIKMGFKVFVWPPEIEEKIKDINDVVLHTNITDITQWIDSHSYQGLKLKLKYDLWKRI